MKKRRKAVTMMGTRIGKGAGVGAQLRMRRSDPDPASGNEAGTEVVGDPVAGRIVAAGVGVEVARGEDEAGAATGGGGAGVVRIVAVDEGVEVETEEIGAETEGWRQDWAAQLAGVVATGRKADPPRVLPAAWEMFTASFTSGMCDPRALNSLLLLRRGTEGPSSACNLVRG